MLVGKKLVTRNIKNKRKRKENLKQTKKPRGFGKKNKLREKKKELDGQKPHVGNLVVEIREGKRLRLSIELERMMIKA